MRSRVHTDTRARTHAHAPLAGYDDGPAAAAPAQEQEGRGGGAQAGDQEGPQGHGGGARSHRRGGARVECVTRAHMLGGPWGGQLTQPKDPSPLDPQREGHSPEGGESSARRLLIITCFPFGAGAPGMIAWLGAGQPGFVRQSPCGRHTLQMWWRMGCVRCVQQLPGG